MLAFVLPIAATGIIVPLRLRNNAGWNIGSHLGSTGTDRSDGVLTGGGIELRARRRPGSSTVGAVPAGVIPRRRSGSRRSDEAPLVVGPSGQCVGVEFGLQLHPFVLGTLFGVRAGAGMPIDPREPRLTALPGEHNRIRRGLSSQARTAARPGTLPGTRPSARPEPGVADYQVSGDETVNHQPAPFLLRVLLLGCGL